MTENSVKSSSGHGEINYKTQVYEQLWTIPDWDTFQRSEDMIGVQNLYFNTGEPNHCQTKWLLSFKMSNSRLLFKMYWKLIEAKGYPDAKVRATETTTLYMGDLSVDTISINEEKLLEIGQEIEVAEDLCFNSNEWGAWINSNGEITFNLKLNILEPNVPSPDLNIELFHKSAVTQLCANLAVLLKDKATADLRIMTSDGKELVAHKLILKAQCPVFESMFRSDLSENKSGIIDLKDIKAKTMEIFLHFFYSGELLPSWKDPDTVVEFTYAVGKYQLTDILKMLDEVLGRRDEEDATQVDMHYL